LIPALTFRQPWAELIVSGRKTIEIRTWIDPYRGPIWIHAGKTPMRDPYDFGDLPLGAYVGIAELKMILPMDPHRWETWRPLHLDGGPFSGPCYGWVFAEPVRLPTPMIGRGNPKLFFPPADVARDLEAEIARLR
jgi:ASCH domain